MQHICLGTCVWVYTRLSSTHNPKIGVELDYTKLLSKNCNSKVRSISIAKFDEAIAK